MFKGKLRYLERLYSRFPMRTITVPSERIEGSSPPSVFIGREGYPRVHVGPLIPPVQGDTAIMDAPEQWIGNKSQSDIIDFRLTLIRGKEPVNVKDRTKMVSLLQEISLSKSSIDIDAEFKKKPRGHFVHEEMQPFGPSAPLKGMRVDAAKFEPHMERAFYDTDLLSRDAVITLYEKDVAFSSMQKAFSTGAFGLERNRKLVPTRWSITAVDDMLGLHLLDSVKQNPTIDEYRVYETEHLQNKFVVLLVPTHWQYETMEAFFPQIIGDRLEIFGDWEGNDGKKGYAQIGGCYYSARFAIAERLSEERKQAGAIVFRECYTGYVPLGVWNVRENMRDALKQKPAAFDSMPSALAHINSRMRIGVNTWIRRSTMLRGLLAQRKMSDFAKASRIS
ncbi:MAG: hypothetical protein HY368_02720 [Candidatus Aenigmarchaeota archaeon]|nr:hypothetical protein [Candidatus Aenigmarchaeota archaeon]